jgi:hypothetical protein
MSSVTTSTFNTAVGQAALYKHIKNGGNTAIGSNAMQNDTTGVNNTAVGLNALYANTNGGYNTALGRESLKNHVNNNNNTAIGSLALFNDISGIENTAVGYNAILVNTTGINNSALGAYTNFTANNLSNATAIGYRAMVGQSNSLVLGSIIGVNGAVADTKVGIGTTTPTAIFDVNGNFKLGVNGTANTELIKLTINKDVAAVAAGTSNIETFIVANVQTGSTAYISPELALADGLLIAYTRVSAANTVEVKLTNTSGISIDPPAMNFFITVVR